jgi:hypothetical protein
VLGVPLEINTEIGIAKFARADNAIGKLLPK